MGPAPAPALDRLSAKSPHLIDGVAPIAVASGSFRDHSRARQTARLVLPPPKSTTRSAASAILTASTTTLATGICAPCASSASPTALRDLLLESFGAWTTVRAVAAFDGASAEDVFDVLDGLASLGHVLRYEAEGEVRWQGFTARGHGGNRASTWNAARRDRRG